MYMWTNLLCISHKHILVHLGCHSITKTKQGPLNQAGPIPEETKEMQHQVQELLDKGYVHESLSPCVVPVLLVPKKDGSWHMCIGC